MSHHKGFCVLCVKPNGHYKKILLGAGEEVRSREKAKKIAKVLNDLSVHNHYVVRLASYGTRLED